MDENRPAVISRPTSILDVFGTPDDQISPRLSDRQNLHRTHGAGTRGIAGSSTFYLISLKNTSARRWRCDWRQKVSLFLWQLGRGATNCDGALWEFLGGHFRECAGQFHNPSRNVGNLIELKFRAADAESAVCNPLYDWQPR
jgi:hypothetical protein